LNKLLRLLETLPRLFGDEQLNGSRILIARYIFSALLVRFAQYLLAICFDLNTVLPTDVHAFLGERLTFGDQPATRSRELVEGTLKWVERALKEKNVELPNEISSARLYARPSYTDEMIHLLERILDRANEARYLPLAAEVMQFGSEEVETQFPHLRAAARAGEGLAALAKAFLVRTFSLPPTLTDPVRNQMKGSADKQLSPSARENG
jgi:hypothetical protein